jgi:protein TonB
MMKIDTEARVVRRTTANYFFKQQFRKYFLVALFLATLVHVFAFVFMPPYDPEPYTLREKKFEVVEVPPELVIPPPPKEIERPDIPQELELSEEASEEETIAPTSFNPMEPPTLPGGGEQAEAFFAFDEPPVPIHRVAPVYPDLARQAGVEGVVLVRVLISKTGRVIDAQHAGGQANPLLVQAAVDAAKKWLFTPAKQRDEPVQVWYAIPIAFSIQGR